MKKHLQLHQKARALAILMGWLAIACNRHPTAPDDVQFVAATINVTATLPVGAERILAISRARVAAVAYCWGGNGNGQLGDGSTTLRKIPTRVATKLRFQDLGAGKTPQTCAAAIDGTAHCWGWNFFGQLGNGTNADSREPVRVSEP